MIPISALNCPELGDGRIDYDGGAMTGAIIGSFGDNHAIAFDLQVIQLFLRCACGRVGRQKGMRIFSVDKINDGRSVVHGAPRFGAAALISLK